MALKLIVAGGRDFNDTAIMINAIIRLVESNDIPTNAELVCGMAKGADLTARWLWQGYQLPVHEFPADWKTHGKRAGHMRNREMAEYADVLLAFWDGESRGTKNMIETMQSLGKPTHVVRY